ncbi:MAG: 2-amino-4-hydroxy-6-hydroxymethyldihydropteridine diphosphokinase [Bacteroidales bacterium]
MAITYLGLGSNLGNLEDNLHNAIVEISERVGTIMSQSALFHSAPWGFESDNKFLNQVIKVETTLDPYALLERTKEIEIHLGRKKKSIDGGYSDRIIDIDIILYDQLVLNDPILTIPHPLMQQRDFVLLPLQEIASEVIYPLNKVTIGELIIQEH